MTNRQKIATLCEESIVWDGMDDAIIGISDGMRVVYDIHKMQDILMERDKMTHDEAMEYIEYNITSAHVGEFTPIHIYNIDSIEF